MRTVEAVLNLPRPGRRDDPAAVLLRAPTRAPRDLALVTPELYPTAPPLEPASGPERGENQIAEDLATFLQTHLQCNPTRIQSTLARFHDPVAIEMLPDPAVRAGFLTLTGTFGDPIVEPFLAGELHVTRITYGQPADPSRVVGRAARGPGYERVVNSRYRAERFTLLAGSLLQGLLRNEPIGSDDEETMLHALRGAVHLQVISRTPSEAGTTELARRQNSLALALLASRPPGSPSVQLVEPEGPGSDFWSIPFGPQVDRAVAPSPAFALLLESLLWPEVTADRPAPIDEDLAQRLDERVFARELRPVELVRAAVALTVLDEEPTFVRVAG